MKMKQCLILYLTAINQLSAKRSSTLLGEVRTSQLIPFDKDQTYHHHYVFHRSPSGQLWKTSRRKRASRGKRIFPRGLNENNIKVETTRNENQVNFRHRIQLPDMCPCKKRKCKKTSCLAKSDLACFNNCYGHGTCKNRVCHCNPKWTGRYCDILRSRCPQDRAGNHCSGNGLCLNGSCQCETNFTGPDCSTPLCPKNCSGRGLCIDGECDCASNTEGLLYGGSACEQLLCEDDCNQRGSCNNATCACDAGFGGSSCQTAECPHSCNHGECIGGRCKCAEGWTGIRCQLKRCLNKCSNHGKCRAGHCRCWKSWSGRDCSIHVCPNNCSGHGQCQSGKCHCWSQFAGDDCSAKKCRIACGENGMCDGASGLCRCKKEWTGRNCTVAVCPENCSGHGVCQVNSKKCACAPGFSGVSCQNKLCSKKCLNGGHCVAGECQCPAERSGEKCEDIAPPKIESIKNITQGSIEAYWEHVAPAKISGYEINCIPISSSSEARAVYRSTPGNTTTVTIYELEAGTSYTVMLYARIDDALSNPAKSTVRTKVGQPRNLRHANISTRHVRIEWKRPRGQIHPRYRLICSCKKGGTEFELPANQTQITINELQPGTSYTVTLFAVYENEYSKPVKYTFTTTDQRFRPAYRKEEHDVKVIASGTVDGALEPHVLLVRQYNQLNSPQDLEVINKERAVIAQWSPIADAAGYMIELFEQNVTQPSLFQIPASESTAVSIEDYLLPGRQYRLQIYTMDHNGRRSSPLIREFEAQLRAPSDVYIINVGHEHIEIGWKSGVHEFGYVIVVENIPSMDVKKYYTEDDTIRLKGLMPSNAYKLTIMMKSETGKLGLPSIFLVTTAADPPSEFVALKTTHEAVKLSWVPPVSKVAEYKLTLEGLKSETYKLHANSSSYVVSGLLDGQTYHASLQSIPVVVSINSPPTIVTTEFTTKVAPPVITTKYIDSESLAFSWEEPRFELPFAMRYLSSQLIVPDSGFTDWIRFPPGQTTYTLTSLLPATKYFLEARFESTNITSESTFTEFETAKIYVPSVVNPTVTSITYSSATVIWDEPNVKSGVNIDGYTIIYGPDDADRITEPLRVDNDDTIFDLANLDEDTNYSVLISMIADGIKSEPVWVHFQTLLAPPQDLRVDFIGNEMAIITWEESSASVNEYRVQYAERTISTLSPSPEAYQHSWIVIYVSGELTARLPDLKPNTEYEVEVSARQSSNGKYTEPATVVIHTLPSPVTGFDVDKWTLDSVKASWNAPNEDIDYFELELVEVDTERQVSFTKLSSSKTSTMIDNLKPSKWYNIKIAAVSQHQRSVWRHKKVHTELEPPQDIHVTNITAARATVNWAQVSRATSTIVTYRDQTSNQKRSQTVRKGATQIELDHLYPGTSYKLDISHQKSGITSDSTKSIFQTIITYDTPTLKMRLLREDSVELIWVDQYDRLEEIYHLKWRRIGDELYQRVNITSNSFTIPHLTPSTPYETTIQVTRQNGTLTDENRIDFTTLEVLLPVKNIKVKEVAEYSTSLEWETQGTAAERFVLNQEGPFSERKHIVMASHEKSTASTKLKNLIPNMPYKVRITAERLGRQSDEQVIEFRTLPKLKEPDMLTVNYTTSDGVYMSWHIPYAEHLDGAVLSVYEKKLTGHGPVATIHLMKNETEKYVTGLKFETKYRISLYAVRGETTTAKKEVSCRTEIDVKLIEKCKVIEFTENAARGTFSYGPMKRKPVITAMATIVNTPITFDATLRDRLNERSFQFEKLQPNTTYNMSIASAYGFTKTQPCLTTFTTLTKLEPPYEMMIRKVSNDSFSLSWKDLTTDISGYKVRIKKMRENKIILEKDIPAVRMSLKMSGLLPAIRYRVELATLRSARKSKYTSISITTLPNPPTVTGTVKNVTDSTAVLQLRKPEHDISGYIIYYNEFNTQMERKERLIHGLQQPLTTHTLKGLFAGATYNIGVVSIAQSMKSKPNNVTTVLVPGPMEKLRVRNTTDHSCQLVWRLPDVNRSEFVNIALESVKAGTWEKASDLRVSANRSSLSLLPLKPGRKYRATITISRGQLVSSPVQTTFKTLIDPPEIIELMSVERYTARVSWSDPVAVDDVIQFRLQYQANQDNHNSPVKSVTLTAEMRSYDFTDLIEGTPYRLWLTSVGIDSESVPKSVDFHTRIYNFRRPESCVHVKKNGYDQDGIYNIFIGPQLTESHAYCKQRVHDGGWQVIQQRLYQEPYNIPLMSQYQNGFGRADGDYWIGLDAMAQITSIPHELLIQIRDRFGYTMEIRYAFIRVNPAEFGYALQLGEKIGGDLPDEFSRLNSLTFSAFDHNRSSNCEDPSGWWHPRDCYSVNLNLAMGSSLPRIRYPNLERYPDEFEIAEASMMIRTIRAK